MPRLVLQRFFNVINRLLVTLLLTVSLLAGCASPHADPPPHVEDASSPEGPLFVDRAGEVGLDFVHFNGMSGERYFVEMTGAGGALFDYDNDGDLDAYLVQGAMLGDGKTYSDALVPPQGPLPPRDRLFRNDLVETGRLRFTDVTEAAGLDAPGYGMGVAAGDYDNDGYADLYVTNWGANQLWRNNGDGTFAEVTQESGVADTRWSVSASFIDVDRDGWLDLYVVNYVNFSLAAHKTCSSRGGRPDYCGPLSYDPEPDRLFRNRGVPGSRPGQVPVFEDVSGRAGILTAYRSGLGVVAADFDDDGWADLYVANDGMANFLWHNQGEGRFRDRAVLAGAAVNFQGMAEASMGVDAGDLDNDRDEDLFMTHLTQESNTLYLNEGNALFQDVTAVSRLAAPSLPFTGFGTAFLDVDNDGWLDVIAVNGAVKARDALARAGDPYPLHEPNQLFRNQGVPGSGPGQAPVFAEVSAEAGAVFALSEVSRGIAVGDVDNDGDADVLMVNNNGPVRLLINQVGQDRPWLGLRLVGADGRRDMLGARVAVVRTGAETLWRRARSDGSYASARDPRVLVGLGDHPDVERVEVWWPGGHREAWDAVPTGQYTTLVEGTGRPVSTPSS